MADERTSGAPIAIGVPVRDEVERLPRLLEALNHQSSLASFTLCIVFDNCRDGSEQLVASHAPRLRYPIVWRSSSLSGAVNAGRARRQAMALALQHADHGVVLTTDADSEPAHDWIETNLAALGHADVVAGRIIPSERGSPSRHARLADYYDRLHAVRRRIDPVPWEADVSHHWTSGASLACRSHVYTQLDGFPPLANGEDAAFADAAARAGFRLRRDADVVVRTSSRRKGRADQGFAAMLAALDDVSSMPQVIHPEDETWRFRMQANARTAFESGHVSPLTQRLGLSIAEVEQVARECVNAEAFASRIVGSPPGAMRTVTLAHAEALLAGLDLMAMAGAA